MGYKILTTLFAVNQLYKRSIAIITKKNINKSQQVILKEFRKR